MGRGRHSRSGAFPENRRTAPTNDAARQHRRPRPGRAASRPEAGGVPTGRRVGSSVSIPRGECAWSSGSIPESATVYVQEHPRPSERRQRRPGRRCRRSCRTAGRRHPAHRSAFAVRCLNETPYFLGGVETLLQRSEELLASLRCDMRLPAALYPDSRSVSRTQRYMDEACAASTKLPSTTASSRS